MIDDGWEGVDDVDRTINFGAVVDRLRELQALVEEREKSLSEAKEALRRHKEETIPALMDQAGQTSSRLLDGSLLIVSNFVRASIPKGDKPAAMEWIETHDGADIIKVVASATFSKGNADAARELMELMRSAPVANRAAMSLTADVHSQTLCAWLRERIENGLELPPSDVVNVYTGRVASIRKS